MVHVAAPWSKQQVEPLQHHKVHTDDRVCETEHLHFCVCDLACVLRQTRTPLIFLTIDRLAREFSGATVRRHGRS